MHDKPLAEITLRKYEKPYDLTGRELSKKLCLSLGLLQPGDGRDVVVDVFHTLLHADKALTSEDVERLVKEHRTTHNLPHKGVTSSNIRRQIKRLRDIYLIDKLGTTYRLSENANLADIFTERLQDFYLRTIVDRVKDYCHAVDKARKPLGNAKS